MQNNRLPKLRTATVKPASERQIKFIHDLLERKQLSEDADVEACKQQATTMDSQRASRWIDELLKRPDKERIRRADVDLPDVPAGRYAVDNEDGELRFYVVDRPERGQWAGWVFLDVMASDERHPIKGVEAKRTILQKILDAGVYEAMVRFGHELRVCGNCGRTLTNRISRELGIGPVCGGRILGDEFKPLRKAAMTKLEEMGLDPDEEVADDKECGNCGGSPCYHQCPNSPHFYSPEQERQDDAHYGQDDVSERYAGERFIDEMEAMHSNGRTGLDYRAVAERKLAASPNAIGSDLDTRFGEEAPF